MSIEFWLLLLKGLWKFRSFSFPSSVYKIFAEGDVANSSSTEAARNLFTGCGSTISSARYIKDISINLICLLNQLLYSYF